MSAIVEAPATMTSIELLEIINQARAEFGEPKIRNNKFVEKIEDELEGDAYTKSATVPEGGGTPMETIELTQDQCMLVAMRESKGVRRKVLAKLKGPGQERLKQGVSAQLPQTYITALEHLLESKRAEQAAIAERDHAIATKAQIGGKREATAMATASAASRKARQLEQELGRGTQHATIIAVEKASGRKFGTQGFRPLKKWCTEHGVTPPKVPCPRYGEATSWPADAWREAYGIDLGELFGGVVMA